VDRAVRLSERRSAALTGITPRRGDFARETISVPVEPYVATLASYHGLYHMSAKALARRRVNGWTSRLSPARARADHPPRTTTLHEPVLWSRIEPHTLGHWSTTRAVPHSGDDIGQDCRAWKAMLGTKGRPRRSRLDLPRPPMRLSRWPPRPVARRTLLQELRIRARHGAKARRRARLAS
jgi:hypothetical protein